MNIRYTLHGITFEWDSRKAASNARKHEISFELACEAFFDPFVFYLGDEVINDELRETIIGMTKNWRLLYVVFVLNEDIVRVISARFVTKTEREDYENQ
ncbi:MAG: BrnT family toxin [Anaerolineales bacterium]|nr:BrnT family toxin [Chloroflexota bacterium]MBL6980688.1 BrnT family toxin [Anaerolineales bacterium]